VLRPLPRRVGVARVVLHQGEWKFTYGSSCYDEKAGVKLKVAVKSRRCMLTICRPDCTRRSANFGPKSDVVTACGCAATPV
jgi:hypothetical protein